MPYKCKKKRSAASIKSRNKRIALGIKRRELFATDEVWSQVKAGPDLLEALLAVEWVETSEWWLHCPSCGAKVHRRNLEESPENYCRHAVGCQLEAAIRLARGEG